jgi:hypothetical protein
MCLEIETLYLVPHPPGGLSLLGPDLGFQLQQKAWWFPNPVPVIPNITTSCCSPTKGGTQNLKPAKKTLLELKDVMANKLAGFDVLQKTNLVILSELTV